MIFNRLKRGLRYFYIAAIGIVSQTGLLVAQEVDLWYSPRQIALANMAVWGDVGPLDALSNPALLWGRQSFSLETGYARPYGMRELATSAVGVSLRTGKLSWGLAAWQFGFELYSRQSAELAAAFSPASALTVGFGLAAHRLQIKNYGQATRLAVDLGWSYEVSPVWHVLGAMKNAFRARWTDGEPLAQSLSLGVAFRPLRGTNVQTEVRKEAGFSPEARFALSADVGSRLRVRCGFSRNPARFSAGVSLRLWAFSVDYGFSYHSVLGYTHAAGLRWNKR